jgi:hypothetical protein
METEKSFITTTEAARVAEVDRRTILRWCDRYDLGMKIGGIYRVDPKVLNNFLSGNHPKTSFCIRSKEPVQ